MEVVGGEKGTRNLKQDRSLSATTGLTEEEEEERAVAGPRRESKSEGVALGIGDEGDEGGEEEDRRERKEWEQVEYEAERESERRKVSRRERLVLLPICRRS